MISVDIFIGDTHILLSIDGWPLIQDVKSVNDVSYLGISFKVLACRWLQEQFGGVMFSKSIREESRGPRRKRVIVDGLRLVSCDECNGGGKRYLLTSAEACIECKGNGCRIVGDEI